jgi:hypothetical protein
MQEGRRTRNGWGRRCLPDEQAPDSIKTSSTNKVVVATTAAAGGRAQQHHQNQ